jgi:hypothetical protein
MLLGRACLFAWARAPAAAAADVQSVSRAAVYFGSFEDMMAARGDRLKKEEEHFFSRN